MGLAIIVPNVSFSDANLGKVILTENIPIKSLSINAPANIYGVTHQLKISFVPSNTNQRNVTWSIESGNEYASIDSKGLLTIDSSASHNTVVVKATSAQSPSISDTKSIVVTYSESSLIFYDWLLVDQPSFIDTGYVPNNNTKIEMSYALSQIKTYNHIFGRRTGLANAADNFHFSADSQRGLFFSYNADGFVYGKVPGASVDTNKHNISLYKNTGVYDNTTITFDKSLAESVTTLYLGGTNDGSGLVNNENQPMIGKIYETKIYENNVLIHDYIPAKYINGDIGMFDNISGLFIPVSGVGQASVGND